MTWFGECRTPMSCGWVLRIYLNSRYIYTLALTDRQQGREQTLENGSMVGLRLHISTVRISRSQRQSSYKKQSELDMAVLSSVLWLGVHFD